MIQDVILAIVMKEVVHLNEIYHNTEAYRANMIIEPTCGHIVFVPSSVKAVLKLLAFN